jgi:glycosidase
MLRRSTLILLPLLGGAIAMACAVGSNDTLTPAPTTQIPDNSAGTGGTFDPGTKKPGGSGASYGSGASGPGNSQAGSGAGADAGPDVVEEPKPPECTDDLKRCPHDFTYPAGTEKSVVIHGDFAADGWTKGAAMAKDGAVWKVSLPVPWNKPVQYKFEVDGNKTWVPDPVNTTTIDDGFGGKNSLLAGGTCAFWSCDQPAGAFDWRDAVLYFVFVDRFLDGDPSNNGSPLAGVDKAADYQGGDWAGVLKKVNEGYFNDLGVNTLWLTVPLDNTSQSGIGDDNVHNFSAYHGYWPTNLDQPEEHFGKLADLKALVDAAHAKDIKVILDYAMNHVHISSPVYADHKDWFWPLNDDKVQNCVCGAGCSWDDAYQARRCWFRDYLPDFNFTNDTARKFSVDNAIKWATDTGIDGFRLDAIKHIETSWVTDLRARVTSDIEATTKQHFYMVGETFTGDQGLIKSYVDPQSKLDGQFDFPMRMQAAEKLLMRKGSMSEFEAFLAQNDTYYGAGIMSTFIGNHDIPRPIHLAEDTPMWDTQWADGKNRAWSNQPSLPSGDAPFQRLANAFTLLLTSRGVPLIHYGDEIALPGAGDPDNRRMMQWDNYSPQQLTLKAHIKKLTGIRKDHPALRKGVRSTVATTDNAIAYKMTSGGDTLYIVINRGDGAEQVSGLPASAQDLLSGATVSGPSVSVPARTSMILLAP